MHRNLALDAVFVTELAAVAAARLRGRRNKIAADQAAVDAMRFAFRTVPIRGTMINMEGIKDDAPMIGIGERCGMWREVDPKVDIVGDPLDCTTKCSEGGAGAISTLAFAEDGGFLNVPMVMYMNKLAVGPQAKGAIRIARGITWNVFAIAEALRKPVDQMTVSMLKRPRHEDMVQDVLKTGAKVHLFDDGDVMGALEAAIPGTGIDVYAGIGGVSEGVIAAAGLRCLGGDFQGVLQPGDSQQSAMAAAVTGRPVDHVYQAEELAGGHVMLLASGVTDGRLLPGVEFGVQTTVHSIILRSESGSFRRMSTTRTDWP